MQKIRVFPCLFFLFTTCIFFSGCNKDGSNCTDEIIVLENLCGCDVGLGHHDAIEIVSDDCGYRFLTSNIDFIAFYINKIKNDYSLEDMKKLVAIVEVQDIPVVVELGGVLGPGWGPLTDHANGKESALIEIQNSKKWVTAGGTIDYVIFDGPVRRLLYGDIASNMAANGGVLVSGYHNTTRGPFSHAEAASEILFSMQEWRKAYPEIQFILGCNFPNWGWKGGQDYHKRGRGGMNWGDYREVLPVILDSVQTSPTPFSGLIADFPYNYAIGERASPIAGNDPTLIDWVARIRELEDFVRDEGLEFWLYTNTEEQASDEVYSTGTLNYIDLYREAGGAPDKWLFQSWYAVPGQFGPEDLPYSMSWLVNEANKKLNEAASTP